MKYAQKYIHFINGRYVNEGIRITAGILLPSLIMHFFDMLFTGIIMSVGALCVSVADTPGASKHRLQGMFACSLLVAAISVIVYYATVNTFLLGLVLTIFGFLFSMLTVYGNRSSSVGIAALLIMVLSLQTPVSGKEIWINAGYTLVGGVWYMAYSLFLYRLRPYKFIQQVLADYMYDIATYLRLRGDLYAPHPDYDTLNEQLLQQQISIETQQNTLSELLFNSRTIVKESTLVGRVLLKTYLELAELYESIMTTYQQYSLLHKQFDTTGILQEFNTIIYLLAAEMESISLSIKSGTDSDPKSPATETLHNAEQLFEKLRQDFMTDKNVENFVSLGRILHTLQDINERVQRFHIHSRYQVKPEKVGNEIKAYSEQIASDDWKPQLLFSNLHFNSNTFRHALRVSLALLLGFIVATFFKLDRGYWILLTIVVILKPAYALSKKRNLDRLIGTLAGIIIGMFILLFIKNSSVLLGVMIFFMAGSYMFIRTNYFMSVLLMTPYLLIFFQFLYPANIRELMLERVADTIIGSGIAFLASLFLVPAWERGNIKMYMIKMLEANEKYYGVITAYFTQHSAIEKHPVKIARREVLIALANVSDAFNRMLSEPKRHRHGEKNAHNFVVINHTLTAHLTTLSYLLQTGKNKWSAEHLLPVIENTALYFKNARHILLKEKELMISPDSGALRKMNKNVNLLLEKRKTEIAEGNLETITKKELVETKSVTDQFNYIFGDAAAIYTLCREYDRAMTFIK